MQVIHEFIIFTSAKVVLFLSMLEHPRTGKNCEFWMWSKKIPIFIA